MSDVITVINGQNKSIQVDIENLEMTLTYVGDLVETISFNYPPSGASMETYTSTLTYDGVNVTSISPFLVVP
jgi:hypothetical protein